MVLRDDEDGEEYYEEENEGMENDDDGENEQYVPIQHVPVQQNSLNHSMGRNIMNQFAETEKTEIQNIVNMGFETYEVVQMYVACDKNPDLTIQNLMYSR